MTVCSFFLQGRCRYGEKCWNEHPRGGGGGGGRGGGGGGDYSRGGGGDYSRGTPQSNRGGGGFGNRVWVNPQRAGGDFAKPSTFGGRDNSKNTSFGVSTQNRFGTLNTPSSFDRGGHKDENEKHLETIQKDMEIWESSGQWPLSCYSVLKGSISGFVELSQDELRLEYYNGRASGDLQTYGNSVRQLAAQWSNRVQELRAMTASTRSALMAELNNPDQQTSSFGSAAPSGFGSSSAGFGSTAPSGFGSAAPSGFGSTTSSGFGAAPASGFGSRGFGAPAQSSASFSFAPTQSAAPSGFGAAQPQSQSQSQSQSGFGSASAAAPSASSFSFAAPAAKDTSSGFGMSASNFSFSSSGPSSTAPGFGGGGGGFGASTGASGFGQPSSGGTNSGLFASAGTAAAAASAGASAAGLFTPQSELTADELREFTGKRFTLGQIPLKPPPADLLVI